MASELDVYLTRQNAVIEETQTWGGGSLPLRVRSYLSQDLPPPAFVTSIRGFVFQDAKVLVVQDAAGKVHLMPSGQCEAGETWEETLRREILEEAGWTLHGIHLVGFLHFHHLAPKPEGYRYAYPDFVQLVYTSEAIEYRSEAREVGGYEIDASFHPLEAVDSLPLSASQKMFLEAALHSR